MPETGAYALLEERFRRIWALRDAAEMLHWDLATMMPAGGGSARAEQLATLKSLGHQLLTAPEVGDWLDEAGDDPEIAADPGSAANLREMRRARRHGVALSSEQVEALSIAASACESAWREAKAAARFTGVLAPLRELLALVREAANAKAGALGLSPYDALLDEYEPDGRSEAIDRLFAELSSFLPEFLGRVVEKQRMEGPPAPLSGPFPVERQRALAMRLMTAFGFDFRHGRLDESLHPFCGGVPDDVRITTRYDEADFARGLMGVLHETGHALYQRGLPQRWRGQPAGDARGMVLHESQSLLIEMQVCRSRPFLEYAAPLIREAFGGEGEAWTVDNLVKRATRVEPGCIRVDADEVTYPAHIILRYRLERTLLAGELDVADLPSAWAEGMRELLGIEPPDDRLGCLQDIHWYDGAWGYFPTYTLGALAAAQLFDAAYRAIPGLDATIRDGEFSALSEWLRAEVHLHGSVLGSDALLARATGRTLGVDRFKAHLHRRYLNGSA